MAALILPSRRVVQPQGPVEVDWSNPLARGLVSAIGPFRFGFDTTRVGPVTFGANAQGLAHLGNGSSLITASTPAFGSEATILAVSNLRYEAGGLNIPVSIGTSGAGTQLFAIQPAQSTADPARAIIRLVNGGPVSTANFGSIPSGPAGDIRSVEVFCAVYYGDPLINVYRNGIFDVSGRAALGAFGAMSSMDTFSLGGTNRGGDIYSQTGQTQALGLAWNRALSPYEVDGVSENPWQLFKPIERRIWVGAAGGGPAPQTLTAGLSAIISQAQATTAAAGLAVQTPSSASASVGVAIRAAQLAAADVALAVRQAGAASSLLQIAVSAGAQQTSSASVAVRAAQEASAQLGAMVQAAAVASAEIQTAVQAEKASAVGLGAVVQAARVAAADLALAVQQARTAATGLSLQVQAASDRSAAVSLLVRAGFEASAGVGFAVRDTPTPSAAASLAAMLTPVAAATAQLAVQASRSASAGVSAQVQGAAQVVASLQAAVQFASIASASVQTAVARLGSAAVGVGAAISLGRVLGAALQTAVRATQAQGAGVSLFVFDSSALARAPDGGGFYRAPINSARPFVGSNSRTPRR